MRPLVFPWKAADGGGGAGVGMMPGNSLSGSVVWSMVNADGARGWFMPLLESRIA